MTIHLCKICEYQTLYKANYDKHLLTQKHKDKNIILQKTTITHNINNINNKNENETKIDLIILQNEELRKEIEKLKEVNNQNTNKIVKEARAIKKSILTILNTNFKDTPSIDYIKEDQFLIELEKEYKAKITDKDNRLFMRIFSDYDNKKIIKTISDLILKFVKKEDKKIQPVFNIDSSRGNYATKIEDLWHNDKCGLQLKKYTLEMVIKYMLNVLDKFRLRLVEIRKENIKKSTGERSDFLMKYSTLLLEVNAFLTNSNTHKKIILQMCPELRVEQKLLEIIKY